MHAMCFPGVSELFHTMQAGIRPLNHHPCHGSDGVKNLFRHTEAPRHDDFLRKELELSPGPSQFTRDTLPVTCS